jgi:hypothetical protein
LVISALSEAFLRGCGFLLCHFFLVVGWVGFLVWALFCLLFGCGVGCFGFTSMLFCLVVGVGNVESVLVVSCYQQGIVVSDMFWWDCLEIFFDSDIWF